MSNHNNSIDESQQAKQAEQLQPSEQQANSAEQPQLSGQPGVIYKITCKLNGKGYVGQTKQTLEARIHGHKSHSKIAKDGVDAAIEHHKWENFTVEVLEICHVELLNEREIFWIAKLNTKVPNGYNLTDGGSGTCGRSPSPEARAKIAEKLKGRPSPLKGKPLSKEHKAKLSANHADFSGENHPFFGKHHSLETCAKLSAANTGENNPNYGKP
ncbi:MAG: GIY-YIG nuclease family protein, partial [Selenomonadaceae bacterium]|nr:GIY-YIG nuclease family protein [Selenomonadaceae bacterium]